MSLVLEALRRVEKPDSSPGAVGVAVPSFSPKRQTRGTIAPLLLGVGCGVVLTGLLQSPPELRNVANPATPRGATQVPSPGATTWRPGSATAELPESTTSRPRLAGAEAKLSRTRPPVAAPSTPVVAKARPLVLQALSQRDSYPIAVINDQLVKEGDLIGSVRVLRIGPNSVEVLLPSGQRDTVQFAAPPEADSSPTPKPSDSSRRE